MQFALSKDAVDLLDELLEKERDALDDTDPNEAGCLLSKDEYNSRMAALNELQGIVAKCKEED